MSVLKQNLTISFSLGNLSFIDASFADAVQITKQEQDNWHWNNNLTWKCDSTQ